MLLLPAAAAAAPGYSVYYGNNGLVINSSTPIVRDSSWSWTTGFDHYEGVAHAYALNGAAGVSVNSRADWFSIYGTNPGITVGSWSSTNDFVITGPPGVTSVSGTFYFTLRGRIDITGGWVANPPNGGMFQLRGSAAGNAFLGQMTCGIGVATGGYAFTGLSQNPMGTVWSVSGSFPVGTPFVVYVENDLVVSHYGNYSVSPSLLSASQDCAPLGATAGIGSISGLIMDLPAGYDLSAPSWNVLHNHTVPVLDVARDLPPAQLALSVASGNPGPGPALLRFVLPASAHVELAVYDVAGRQVCGLASGWRAAGTQSVEWDGRDGSGRAVAPGVYLAAIREGGRSAAVRLVRLR